MKTIQLLAHIVLLPMMIIIYALTKNVGVLYLINAFVGIVFAVTLLVFGLSFFMPVLPEDQYLKVRTEYRNQKTQRYFGRGVMLLLTLGLFFYVNSFIGTIYALSVVMLLVMQYRLMKGSLR